jgi:hypothetical protein
MPGRGVEGVGGGGILIALQLLQIKLEAGNPTPGAVCYMGDIGYL